MPRKKRVDLDPMHGGTPSKPRCTAKGRLSGEPCKNPPRRGATVCRMHGGSAPQVLAKAERQLEAKRDALMAWLLGIAGNEDLSASDRLKAITWALERAGFKSSVDVTVAAPEWQEMLRSMWEESSPPLPASAQPIDGSGHRADADEQLAKMRRALEAEPAAEPPRHYGDPAVPLHGEVLPAARPGPANGTRVHRARTRA